MKWLLAVNIVLYLIACALVITAVLRGVELHWPW